MNANAPALHIDGIIISVAPHPEHEYTLTTAEVAAGYGISEITLRRHKSAHSDELIEGKHFLVVVNESTGVHNSPSQFPRQSPDLGPFYFLRINRPR